MSESATTPEPPAATFPLREKLVATTLHLLLSCAFVGALLLLITQVWYPGFLFETDGGWQGLRIVILVDLVLGPLLTFVVFRRGKKGLTLDLTLIALMQLTALLGGGWIVHDERPIALVFHEGRIYSVNADDYRDAGVPVPELDAFPARPPDYVVLVPPEDPLAQSTVRTAYIQRRQFLYTHVPWMRKRHDQLEQVLASASDLEDLGRSDEERSVIEGWLRARDTGAEAFVFVPYSSRFEVVYLAVDRATGAVVDVLDVSSLWAERRGR